jgi:N-carbamoyl-L-amino-acid hydrolase
MRADPVRMSARIQAAIETTAKELGLGTRRMPSGAGHDAQVLAAVTDAGMIFVPSEGGRSHRPDEWTDWPALERGANMLLGSLLRLAS